MTAEEMQALKLHFQFIGTTWTEWEERQRRQNELIEDVYPNKRAPIVVIENGEHVVREDMLWCFPKYKPGANWGTNFRTLKNSQWRPWLDREHRSVVPAMAFAEPDKNTPKGNMMWRGSSARTNCRSSSLGSGGRGRTTAARRERPTLATTRCSR